MSESYNWTICSRVSLRGATHNLSKEFVVALLHVVQYLLWQVLKRVLEFVYFYLLCQCCINTGLNGLQLPSARSSVWTTTSLFWFTPTAAEVTRAVHHRHGCVAVSELCVLWQLSEDASDSASAVLLEWEGVCLCV